MKTSDTVFWWKPQDEWVTVVELSHFNPVVQEVGNLSRP